MGKHINPKVEGLFQNVLSFTNANEFQDSNINEAKGKKKCT